VALIGVSATAYIGVVSISDSARPTFDGITVYGYVGSVNVTTTSFDYEAVKNNYDTLRAVYVGGRTTAKDRTIVINEQSRVVYVDREYTTRTSSITEQFRNVYVSNENRDNRVVSVV